MSEPPRCHDCGHRKGPRSTGKVIETALEWTNRRGEHKRAEAGRTRKAPCHCACHTQEVAA